MKRRVTRVRKNRQLSILTTPNLLRLYSDIMEELRAREAIRSSNNPVADYAEKIVADKLNLKLQVGSNKGFDALDSRGFKYQIKGRRPTKHNPSRQLSAIRDLKAKHFKYLIAVIFNEDFSLKEIWKIPHALVLKYTRFSNHVNAHLLSVKGPLLKEPTIKLLHGHHDE